MKKNGFTLIELLAVIVVLAIISLIAVPIVLNIIEKARIGVFRSSIYGLEKAAELYTVNSNYNEEEKLEFICDSNTCETVDGKNLNFKGEVPIGGSIIK